MYKLILAFVLLTGFNFSTDAQIIKYTAAAMYEEIETKDSKTLGSRPYGKEVEILVDTFFKKYTITFTDQDDVRTVLPLKFVRNYFGQSDGIKLYLMEFQQEFF